MDLASRIFSSPRMRGPAMKKAMILRESGSTIGLAIAPMGPEDCILRIGIPISREL